MKLSRYFLTFGVVVLIGLGLVGGGVFLLVQRETGTRAQAKVIHCTKTIGRHGGGVDCIGTWVIGGSVAAGGHVVTGSIDGARRSDLGKTLDVTVRGDRAYTRSLRTPIVLLAVGFAIASFMGIVVPVSLARANRRAASRAATPATTQAEVPAAMSVEDAVRRIRKLRRAGRLAEAVALVDRLGPYGVNDEDDWDTSLGASVLAAYAEQISAIDPEGARAAYKRAGQLQRAFASGATSGGEGVARIGVAERYEAKAR